MPTYIVEAYDGVPLVPIPSYHIFPVGLHSQYRLARDPDPARAAMKSVSGGAAHHMRCLSQSGTTRPTTSNLHPSLGGRERLLKRYLALNRLPVRGPLPDDRHSYK